MAITLFVHLTWTTLDRRPMIGVSEAKFLRGFIPARAHTFGAKTLAMGIVQDHLHVILEIPGEFNIPKMVQSLKGASSCIINRESNVSQTRIRWCSGYDLRSVSPSHLPAAIAYVKGQGDRHPDLSIEKAPS